MILESWTAALVRLPTITGDRKIELDRRLDTYAVDKNRGRPAADAVRDIRRRLWLSASTEPRLVACNTRLMYCYM